MNPVNNKLFISPEFLNKVSNDTNADNREQGITKESSGFKQVLHESRVNKRQASKNQVMIEIENPLKSSGHQLWIKA